MVYKRESVHTIFFFFSALSTNPVRDTLTFGALIGHLSSSLNCHTVRLALAGSLAWLALLCESQGCGCSFRARKACWTIVETLSAGSGEKRRRSN